MSEPVPAVVLFSGSGRTLANLLTRQSEDRWPLEITAAVSSRPSAGGINVARDHGVSVATFARSDYQDVSAHNEAINQWLSGFQPQIVILAGYLCYYTKPRGFSGPVVNIHPALLPKYGGKGYYGSRVHRAVLDAGEAESGCTVHLVDEVYDHGEILGQRRVPVLAGDDVESLAARVFAAECVLYPQVLSGLARRIGGR